MSSKALIRVYRQKLHMSTVELGNELNVSDKKVRNWELALEPIPAEVLKQITQIIEYYEEAWDLLTLIAQNTARTVQVYKGYVKGNTEQCPPNTWLGIVGEAVLLSNGRLTPIFPEEGDADIKVMPIPLRELPSALEPLTNRPGVAL